MSLSHEQKLNIVKDYDVNNVSLKIERIGLIGDFS